MTGLDGAGIRSDGCWFASGGLLHGRNSHPHLWPGLVALMRSRLTAALYRLQTQRAVPVRDLSMAYILLVEDNETNTKLFRVVLERSGHTVRCTTHAEEALAALQAQRPDLILMDIQLPVVDGITLTKQIKQSPETAAIPIIAVTAHAMFGDEERIKESGCDGYLSKPVNLADFAAIVERHLCRVEAR